MRLGDALAGARAMRLGDGGEEQVQVAGDVGHGADGGARIAAGGLLLDRDHRREAEDEIDVRLGDLGDEALGVAGQRLHVAPLSFGVDGVEGQARFARARQAGDDDELVARQFERDVLEVVDARALDGDGGAVPLVCALDIGRPPRGGKTPVPPRRRCSFRQPDGKRRLADETLVRQVLAHAGDAFDAEVALEMIFDFGGRSRFADFPQMIDDGSEKGRGPFGQIIVDGRQCAPGRFSPSSWC